MKLKWKHRDGDPQFQNEKRYFGFEVDSRFEPAIAKEISNWKILQAHPNQVTKGWRTYVVLCESVDVYYERRNLFAGRNYIHLLN